MINSNLHSVIKAVSKQTDKIDENARKCRDEMMTTLMSLAKREIKGQRPKGQKATIGQPPMNRTGNLRRSIKGEKSREGFGTYSAVVGPTIVYGRSLEIGGQYAPPTWSKDAKYPYMQPAFIKFRLLARGIIRKHMTLRGR